MRAKICVATCQFPTDSEIGNNFCYISQQMRSASEKGATVAHFPEACLSGYAGADIPSYEGFDWALLKERMQKVLDLARRLHLWVILGSAHRLSGKHKP